MGAQGTPVPLNYRITTSKEERIRKIEPFTIEEIKQLQAEIENTFPDMDYAAREMKHYQLKLIFVLYYACGLRLSEGYRLTAKEIDFNRRTVFIRQGKNYKDRIIPMNDNMYHALQDYLYNFRNHINAGTGGFLCKAPLPFKETCITCTACAVTRAYGKNAYRFMC